jgi:hypothetical protein
VALVDAGLPPWRRWLAAGWPTVVAGGGMAGKWVEVRDDLFFHFSFFQIFS